MITAGGLRIACCFFDFKGIFSFEIKTFCENCNEEKSVGERRTQAGKLGQALTKYLTEQIYTEYRR